MKIKVQLPISKEWKKLVFEKSVITVSELVQSIERTPWGKNFIEESHIKPPYALVIDEKLILMKDNPDLLITESSDIKFITLFTGG